MTVIKFDHSKKEAVESMNKQYNDAKFIKVYKYSKGSGNNFYEFTVSSEK